MMSMLDDKKNLRQKGRLHSTGKIYRGCVQDASSKINVGCIPANYQTIVYRVNSVKSFGTSQARFARDKSSTPGPGCYRSIEPRQTIQNFNQKGSGPLLSKTKRNFLSKTQCDVPGPGKYDISSDSFSTKHTSQENRLFIFSFEKRVLSQNKFKSLKENNPVPGPGHYDSAIKKAPLPSSVSSFKSKVQRKFIFDQELPGPGYYDLTKQVKKKNRNFIFPEAKKKKKDLIQILEKGENQQSRPGNYDLSIPDFKPMYQKLKNSGNFVQGVKDRFGNNAEQYQNLKEKIVKRNPGPGHYNTQSGKSNSRGLMMNSFFMSNTIRDPMKVRKDVMGPNLQQVKLLGRKEFILNLGKQWI